MFSMNRKSSIPSIPLEMFSVPVFTAGVLPVAVHPVADEKSEVNVAEPDGVFDKVVLPSSFQPPAIAVASVLVP